MKSRPLAPLGAPTRVTVTKVVRVSYRIEWEYDGVTEYWSEDSQSMEAERARKRRVRHMQGRGVAYRAAAMRYIFSRRDRYAKEIASGGKRVGCTLCDTRPVWSETDGLGHTFVQACRYHSEDHVEPLRSRLARWLMWRDGVAITPSQAKADDRGRVLHQVVGQLGDAGSARPGSEGAEVSGNVQGLAVGHAGVSDGAGGGCG